MSARLLDFETVFGSLSKGNGVTVNRSVSSVDVSVEIPGYTKGDITVTDAGEGFINVLAKNSQREDEFQVLVGDGVDIDSAEAKLNNDVLNISFAKKAVVKRKTIKVS